MKMSPAGTALTRHFEGCKLEAYPDAGKPPVWTIGWGHTGPDVTPGLRITQERADQLLARDLAIFESAVTYAVRVPLKQCQFDALVAFAFNVRGWRGSTLIKKLNAGDLAGAAEEFPCWCHAGGEVLEGLVLRRAAEQRLFNGLPWEG